MGGLAFGRGRRVVPLILAALFLLAAPAHSLQWENGGSYDSSRHDRFLPGTLPSSPVPNPNFHLSQYEDQLRSVGWKANYPPQKVTLVTPQHFLNADHWKAAGSVSFIDVNGIVRTYAIATNEKVQGDIAVGTLAAPIPPEHGVPIMPIASFAQQDHIGREVLYVGNAPDASGFAVGRSAISATGTSSNWLNNDLVDSQLSLDRVIGITGDSGAPSLFAELDGLSFVGTHYSALTDQVPGTHASRAIIDDYVAKAGALLTVYGEGRIGDPSAGDLVVTGVSPDLGLHFDGQSGQDEVLEIRIHDFSGSGASVEVAVAGSDFGVRIPGANPILQQLVVATSADAAGTPLEVVYTGTGSSDPGTLLLTSGATSYAIPIDNDAVDVGIRPSSMTALPEFQGGSSGGGGVPGDTLTYFLAVTNNDLTDTTASFDFSTGCPWSPITRCSNGWQLVFDPPTLTVAAGETANVALHVTPADGAELALYTITVGAHDASQPGHDAEASTIYWVNENLADQGPPTAPTGLWATGDTSSVTLTWNPSQDDIGVDYYSIERDGEPYGQAFTTQFTDTRTKRNQTHVYVVYAVDAAGWRSDPSASIAILDGVVVGGGGDPDDGGEICIPTRHNEKGRFCRDGLDNDCDGQIDGDDPDC